MKRATIVSGKNGGLQTMIPMMEHFLASGRWEVDVLLWDQHTRSRDFGNTCELPDGVRVCRGYESEGRVPGLFENAFSSPEKYFSDADVVIVYGDRADALLAATKAHEYGTPVAHLQAGDLSGGIDHANRYATTALCKWAFCATTDQLERLRAFRDAARLYFAPVKVGDHHIDAIKRVAPLDKGAVLERWVVHLHPDTLASPEENRRIATMVVSAVGKDGDYIMPCNDRMHEIILEVYKQHGIEPIKYLPLETYVHKLCTSKGLIGNSSAVIIDAPALGVRAINVGYRQVGRGQSSITKFSDLKWAMSLPPRTKKDTWYGDGEAGRRTFEILDGVL